MESYRAPTSPVIVASIARNHGLPDDDALALLTDATRAPAIMAVVRERFGLSDDYDGAGPEGLQLFAGGWLPEVEAQWLDGVVELGD
jgi:hypothetical protein